MRRIVQNSKFLDSGLLSALAQIKFFGAFGQVNSVAAPYRIYDLLKLTIICSIFFYLFSNLKSLECRKSIFLCKIFIMSPLRFCRSWRSHNSHLTTPITTMSICKSTECFNIIKRCFSKYIYSFTDNGPVCRH